MTIATSPYAGGTERMQADTAAPTNDGAAVVLPGPGTAVCAAENAGALDWVPDREQALVPEPMARLCQICPGRVDCLAWAMATSAQGYWAATTTAQREQLVGAGDGCDLEAADRVRADAHDIELGGALHPEGEGSWWWYRNRGCRCLECRQCNAARRAAERQRSRARMVTAA